MRQTVHDTGKRDGYDADIDQSTWVLIHLSGGLARHLVQRRIADQSAGLADLVHDGVTGIETQAASDTSQLLPITDIRPRRADLHALEAVDAVPLRRRS